MTTETVNKTSDSDAMFRLDNIEQLKKYYTIRGVYQKESVSFILSQWVSGEV